MREVKICDLKAPRFRPKKEGTINKDFLKRLRKDIPGTSELSDAQIKKIISTFNGILWKEVINNREGVDIPERLGHLFIGCCPKNIKSNIDYKATREQGKAIEHRNWESDGHLAKIFYTTFQQKYRFRNSDLWGFDATRDFSRSLAASFPENWKKYIEIGHRIRISAIFRRNSFRMDKAKETKIALEDYNEFDI